MCISLVQCTSLAERPRSTPGYILDSLESLGALYHASPEFPLLSRKSVIDDNGDIHSVGLVSDKINKSSFNYEFLRGVGDIDFMYDSTTSSAEFHQECGFDHFEKIDSICDGQYEFLLAVIQYFKPSLATIGDPQQKSTGYRKVVKCELTKLSWCMVFGESYCGVYGRNFFLNSPADRIEDLDGAGVAVKFTSKYSDWASGSRDAFVKYFASNFQMVK
jgi:hypothetical protein